MSLSRVPCIWLPFFVRRKGPFPTHGLHGRAVSKSSSLRRPAKRDILPGPVPALKLRLIHMYPHVAYVQREDRASVFGIFRDRASVFGK